VAFLPQTQSKDPEDASLPQNVLHSSLRIPRKPPNHQRVEEPASTQSQATPATQLQPLMHSKVLATSPSTSTALNPPSTPSSEPSNKHGSAIPPETPRHPERSLWRFLPQTQSKDPEDASLPQNVLHSSLRIPGKPPPHPTHALKNPHELKAKPSLQRSFSRSCTPQSLQRALQQARLLIPQTPRHPSPSTSTALKSPPNTPSS
jgi:hypothetical protein